MTAPGFLADVDRFPQLARSLADGATALDGAAVTLPDPPEAGASTAVVPTRWPGSPRPSGCSWSGCTPRAVRRTTPAGSTGAPTTTPAHGLPGHPL